MKRDSFKQGMTTEAQGGSDMAAKIGSGLSGRAHHRNVRDAILEVGLPHRLKPEFPVEPLRYCWADRRMG